MEAAALVAIVLSNGQGSAPDWEDLWHRHPSVRQFKYWFLRIT
jgi:hypothetical protein